MSSKNLKYLTLLSKNHKNINEVTAELIKLSAILNLPKGTEHFVSDIHGEDESFDHVLRNASGVIKVYIDELFGDTLMASEKRNLATMIYYPVEKLDYMLNNGNVSDEWYKIQLFRLLKICKRTASKHTRTTVRKSLPLNFDYILEELIFEDTTIMHKQNYYHEIIDNIISLGRAGDFIVAISEVIQHLAIDHLHVLGDIYDRGDGAARVMEILHHYHSVDIQWGNHDISWMGAASGCLALICNVIRISARYGNLSTIEEDYGINLVPLATFAMDKYAFDPCERFKPKPHEGLSEKELELMAKMHKAVAIIQFKLEAEIIKRRPEFKMNDRILLNQINFKTNTIKRGNKKYPLTDDCFPTINPETPLELCADEMDVLEKLKFSFMNSPRLQSHVRFLFNNGSLYRVYNSNLLFHGGIPLNDDGSFKTTQEFGTNLKGKALLTRLEQLARRGFFGAGKSKQQGLDALWYLWCGPNSPLFGKDIMTTFERYFIDDAECHKETYNAYYTLRDDTNVINTILADFELCPVKSRIINGHTPVLAIKGESPVRADGRMLVIDGGFARSYQQVTGIAGYTLIYNSQGLLLAAHAPFTSAKHAIENEADILSDTTYIEKYPQRKKIADTDTGKEIQEQITDLMNLLEAYRSGEIKER